jgi:hypothetical protein
MDGLGRSPLNSVQFAANRHCQTLWNGILGQNR